MGAYKARSVSTEFSESKYVAIAMASNLQILVLGVPILIMVADSAISNYFVRAGIVFLNDGCVLMLIKGVDNADALGTSMGTSAGTTSTQSNNQGELDDAYAEIADLKKQVEDLQAKAQG